jgi:hypothetical protein
MDGEMNVEHGNRRWRSGRHFGRKMVETLEPRILLSLFGIDLNILALPEYVNLIDMSSFNVQAGVDANDAWWIKNTGQTLSNYEAGPATGTYGADLDLEKAWTLTQGRSDVVVAVLDSGMDLETPALAGAVWTNTGETMGDGIDNDGNGYVDDAHGWNFVDGNGDVSDDMGMGTAVAGAIHSVAPGIRILPVKVCDFGGADSQNVIDAIKYIVALKKSGVQIAAICGSFLRYDPPTTDEANAVKRAGDAGILYVAPAGDQGMSLDFSFSGVPSWLAKYIPQVIPFNAVFVAATDNQDNLAWDSDYGPHSVSVGAPGVDLALPVPGGMYSTVTGTPFAAALVAGVAGLLKSVKPSTSMGGIKNSINNAGDKVAALSGMTSTGRRVNAYNALEYLLGKKAPVGAVELLNPTTIAGWAFDANLGSASSTVQIQVDGKLFATVTADQTRNDLTANLGSANHGFTFDASTVPYGKHKIKVYAVDDGTLKPTLIGQGPLIIDTDPIGEVESAGAKAVTGWTFDSDTPGKSTQVKLFLDGKAWKTTSANVARADLASQFPTDPAAITGVVKHGFRFNLGTLKPGIHRLDVYAVDTLTGLLTALGAYSVASNQPATGAVEVLNATTLSGWAYDADARGSAIQIRCQIDDGAPVFVTAKLSRPDLLTQLGSKNHGFNVAMPQLPEGDHTIRVSAVDPNNKMLVPLAAQVVTVTAAAGNALPSGTIDFAGLQITGTVTDGDFAGPIPIRISVDTGKGSPKMYTTTATADGGGRLAFAYTLPVLTGPARVDVAALDDLTGVPVLLARQFVNFTTPSATVESFTSASVIGVAVAPSASKGLALLRLDVDDLAGSLVTANAKRPDQFEVLGRTNVGFVIPMPMLAPGSHTARLYAVDPTTLEVTLLGTLDLSTT